MELGEETPDYADDDNDDDYIYSPELREALSKVSQLVDETYDDEGSVEVGRCRFTLSKSVLNAPMVSALESMMS